MKRKNLTDALNEIRDEHIMEAIHYKRRRLPRWVYPIAAVLAVAVLAGVLWRPASTAKRTDLIMSTQNIGSSHAPVDPGIQLQYLVATPDYPKLCGYPLEGNDSAGYQAWREDQTALHNHPEGYADSLASFWENLLTELMADGQNNVTCSPVNIYMALAMLAEITDGDSRQQILDTLGADSIEALRLQASQVWQAHYNDDGLSTSILANSLWLEENYGFNQETADLLAENYYASVFQGDLGSSEMNEVLQAWLDQQTGGLLKDQIQQAKLDPASVLALASTIYYRVQWVNGFNEDLNTQDIFHGTNGDSPETFMHQTLSYGPYYWSDNFGAVALSLESGDTMWLILPDEGVNPEDIVGEVQDFLNQDPYSYDTSYENKKDMIVNLSVPKFDISSDLELSDVLKNLGITEIFEEGNADFSPILPQNDDGYICNVQHAARVSINEDGITAAAFTLILRCGSAMPPDDEMDFVLDRPFLFYVESKDGLPLFTGIVNEP